MNQFLEEKAKEKKSLLTKNKEQIGIICHQGQFQISSKNNNKTIHKQNINKSSSISNHILSKKNKTKTKQITHSK